MVRKRLIRFVFILVSLLTGWLSNAAQAKPAASVGLISFTAKAQENGIRLDWETATEDTEGFYIKRSLSSSGPFIILGEIGFIGSEGDVATGATYSRVDETAVYGTTYTYQLVEIESDLTQTPLETVTITFIIIPTATPIVLGGDDPPPLSTNTPVPTSTPSPTGTVQNTAVPPTATHTPSNQAIATATPSPTATPLSRDELDQPQPTNTPAPVIDTTFSEESGDSGVVFAQEDDGAYPGPDAPPPAPDSDAAAYPDGQQPTAVPGNPTSYPAKTAVPPPTIAVIGNGEEPSPPPESYPPNADQSEIIRGRTFLWVGFTVAMLIFIGGVAGSIVLYRRKRE